MNTAGKLKYEIKKAIHENAAIKLSMIFINKRPFL